MGANGGSTKVPGAEKIVFSKVVPRPLWMRKQVFLGRFEPVGARFGPWKIPKCLENGPFQDQKWVKNGSITQFSNSDPGPFMMLKQVLLAHFEPVVTRFGPWKIPFPPKKGPLTAFTRARILLRVGDFITRRGFYYVSGILLRVGDFITRRGFYYASGILIHRPTRNTFITRNIITPSPTPRRVRRCLFESPRP